MTLQSLIPLKARTGIAALSFVAMMVPLLGPGYASAVSFVRRAGLGNLNRAISGVSA
jgi:hypothetical protein